MNNSTLSFLGMIILIFSGYVMGKFFDIGLEYYMPFLLWFLALCVFNMVLDKQHVNIYLKDMKNIESKKGTIMTQAMNSMKAIKDRMFAKSTKIIEPTTIIEPTKIVNSIDRI